MIVRTVPWPGPIVGKASYLSLEENTDSFIQASGRPVEGSLHTSGIVTMIALLYRAPQTPYFYRHLRQKRTMLIISQN